MKKKINILPLNLNKSGCDAMSSNCVVWQGPDIPCLNICKGASITEVMYQIATSFCEMYATLDPDNYNYECLNIDECDVKTFQHLFQAVLNKVCLLEAGGCNMIADVVKTNQSNVFETVVSGGFPPYTYDWSIQTTVGAPPITQELPDGKIEVEFEDFSKVTVLKVKVEDSKGCFANAFIVVII
jgi:hypothetical protein